MKIQLDIPYDINHALKVEKAQLNLNNLQDLILLILQERYTMGVQE